MKLCHKCGQALAQVINNCPACGVEVANGLTHIDHYTILDVIHEGQNSILCKATQDGIDEPVAIRIFSPSSGVDSKVAERLKEELESLKKLPEDWFVQHHAIKCSEDGLWYRVSEWLEAESWGDLLSSGRLRNLDLAYDLFYRLAAILDGLHKIGHFIPHLILNDILILKSDSERVEVKIDYKLSRFLDPGLARPGPMLQKLLHCHPDLQEGGVLDFRSDIWALGRIYAQILTVDLDLGDPVEAAKRKDLPKEIGIVIRSMIAVESKLRPRSMEDVADGLKRIMEEHRLKKKRSPSVMVREIKKLKKTVLVFGVIFTVLAVFAAMFLMNSENGSQDIESTFSEYADQYAGSVAFIVVQYHVSVEGEELYRKRTEGTAFLIDHDGYLLTNRHVACPWLEDEGMFNAISYIRSSEKTPVFEYEMYLWFEGAKAFNKLVGIGGSDEIDDIYDLSAAYRSNGYPRVEIAGVAQVPDKTGQMVKSPLKDDFAVLKIDKVPKGLRPLKLDRNFSTADVKRLSPVITLGFPLGRTSQVDTITVSITRGNIRRSFDDFFQVDTSIYKGNSGGPIVDERGKVIGLVSAVATDLAMAPMTVITQLSDIGLVLPVNKVVSFVDQLKEGKSKWNGGLDLYASARIKEITDAAYAGEWGRAKDLSQESVKTSDDPMMVMASAMIHYCTGNMQAASQQFDQLLSIDPDNYQARFMRYLVERFSNPGIASEDLPFLLAQDWQSVGEFYGYLARVSAVIPDEIIQLEGWNSPAEKGWVHYINGLLAVESNQYAHAVNLFKSAARASMHDEWPLFLALSSMEKLVESDNARETDFRDFKDELDVIEQERKQRMEAVGELMEEFEDSSSDPAKRREVLLSLLQLDEENKKLLAYAAFYGAMASEWQEALDAAEKFLELPGRKDALRLGVGLLVPGVLKQMGREKEALDRAEKMLQKTDTEWYRMLHETILDNDRESDLLTHAGNIPVKLLTAYTTLGFQAEAAGEKNLARKYYREALGSYMDDWAEYEFARQRYIFLRDENE